MNVSSLTLLDILQNARIEEPKAKAIVRTIEEAIQHQELSLKDFIEKKMDSLEEKMVSKDEMYALLAEQESRIIKWVFGLLVSQAIVVLGGVFFMVSHAKP